jgi:peptidyl-prolyl cis-trans isomerase SurA
MLPSRSVFAGLLLVVAAAGPAAAQGSGGGVGKAVGDSGQVTYVPIDGVAAVVGPNVILVSEVLARANQRRAAGAEPRTPRELAELQREVLQELIESELLVQRARQDSIQVNENEVQRALDQNEKQIRAQFRSDLEFRQALREAGFGSYDEWRRMQADDVRRRDLQRDLVQKLRRDGKMTAVNVSEREVTEAYERAKDRLPRKEARVGLRQIVVPTVPSEASKRRARAKADSLLVELRARPDDFESIAKRESMDPGSKELGGDLGWNRRGRMVPEFDRVMFALNPGQLSQVIETVFGYHIIRVDRVQPAEVKARHILIRATMDSTDEARAAERAAAVAAAWRAGGDVDSLTAIHHDEAGQEEKTIPEFPRDSLPESYRNAIEGAKVGDILDPFPIFDPQAGVRKFVVVQVTFMDEAGEYTLDEVRDRIRAQLSEERSMRRLIDGLKKQTYVAIQWDPLSEVPPDRP